jgi:hypothetical protein
MATVQKDRGEIEAAQAARLLEEGLESEGTYTRGERRPNIGSTKAAAAGVAASVLLEEAEAQGDPNIAARVNELDLSQGFAAPEPLDDRTAGELGIEAAGVGPGVQMARAFQSGTGIAAPHPIEHPYAPQPVQGYAEAEPDADAWNLAQAGAATQPPPDVEPAPEPIDLSAKLPPEYEALLEDDDVDEEPLGGIVAESDDETYDPEEFAYDERAQAIARENAKLKRKLEQTEKARLKAARVEWLQKDLGHFPAVTPERAAELARQSTSHRDFIRAMKAENARVAPIVERALAAERARLAKVEAELAAARKQAQTAAWGAPVAGEGAGVGAVDMDLERKLAVAKERGGLGGKMTELLRAGVFNRR